MYVLNITYYIFVLLHVGRSKANDCVTNQLLPGFQIVFNTVMSFIKNSVCLLFDQRPKAMPSHTFSEKDFHTTKPAG